MTDAQRFDTLILGSGQGGKQLAWHLGRSGNRVAVVERRWVGGSCPAVACLPSKNELWGARVAHLARHAERYGTMTGDISIGMTRVRQRKQEMIEREIAAHLKAYKESGAELIMGSGRFAGAKTLAVELNDGGIRRLTADRIVINVGSHAAIPDLAGLREARPLTHVEALELDYVPAHLIVLGGGYVAIELAQAYRRFGSRVSIIEPAARIMGRADPDFAAELHRILSNEGIEILVSAEVAGVDGLSGDSVRIRTRSSLGDLSIEGSDLLVAIGRVPNTANIGLEEARVKLDAHGYIEVNDRLETSAPDVWAIGECAGTAQFTHASVDDFRIVSANMAGGNRTARGRLIPNVLFTDPPLAHVGMTELEAQRQGVPVRVATLPMARVLRTLATDETDGFMKVVVSSNDDRILGFTMLGSEAGEVMGVVQTAMLSQLPYQALRDAVLAHLTFAEGLGPLLSSVPRRGGY
ncbi:MAG TPA: FAD-dependent oxidoreductase [Steroidobacteraceae bacterium]|nr:FAD-dependent oxidoreductase [Steroidobacteraceae bacterium]